MKLQFILGIPGKGKTRLVLEQMLSGFKGHESSFICIVPEQFSLETEKELLALSGKKALVSPVIMTFQRLAYRLFREHGLGNTVFLDDLGKNILLRKATLDLKENLHIFARSADKQGFIDALARTISEFYRYNIPPEALRVSGIQQGSLQNKLQDLFAIFQYFTNYISDRYICQDAALDLVPERVKTSPFLQNAHIWVDGFHGFTPQEYRILEELMKTCATVNVALSLDALPKVIHPYDPFYEIKRTARQITILAEENNLKIAPPIHLKELKRYTHFPEMDFLVRNYFDDKNTKKIYRKKTPGLILTASPNIYHEVTQAAIDILALVRDESYRYKDIALAVGTVADYEKIIPAIFSAYDIPVFVDTRQDILSHPLTELVRGAVEIPVSNWRYEAVFRFLKTGLTTLTRDEIDILENYVLANGIKGYKWKAQNWPEEMAKIKDKVLNSLAPFLSKINKKKTSVRDCAVGIFNMLQELDIPLQNIDGQVWDAVCQVFDKLVEVLGDEEVFLYEFSKILDTGLKAVDMGVIPATQDRVILGDVTRSRLPDIKALFVLGANEGVLPPVLKEEVIFADDERSALMALGIELAADSCRQTLEGQMLLMQTITKPSQKLFLSYRMGDSEGKAMRKASFIHSLKKMFPKLDERTTAQEGVLTLPGPMFFQIGHVLRKYAAGRGIEPLYQDLYLWFLKHEHYGEKLVTMEKILFKKRREAFLPQEAVKKLYGPEVILGVSGLEQYMRCPFAYYVNRHLMAEKRKLYEVQAVDVGTLFHHVLEKFSQRLEYENISWHGLSLAHINSFVEDIIKQQAHDMFNSTAKNQVMLQRMGRIAKRSIWALCEHIKRGSFLPIGAELTQKMELQINPKHTMVLTGRADRVDVMEAGDQNYVKIIDYKTSSVGFDLNDVYFGIQLQLIAYMDAFLLGNSDKKTLPGGVFYFTLDDPVVDLNNANSTIMGELELQAMLLKSFKMSGLVLEDPQVIQGMDKHSCRRSDIIPSASKSLDEFNKLREDVRVKIKDIATQMLLGNINVYPYKKLNQPRTGCDFCDYSAICEFELIVDMKRYNIVERRKT